jgi:hypothetical protein
MAALTTTGIGGVLAADQRGRALTMIEIPTAAEAGFLHRVDWTGVMGDW